MRRHTEQYAHIVSCESNKWADTRCGTDTYRQRGSRVGSTRLGCALNFYFSPAAGAAGKKKAAPYEHTGWKLSAEGVLVSTQCLCHGGAYRRSALACADWRQARNPNKRPFLASARARTRTHTPTPTHRGLSCRLPHVKLRRRRRENDTAGWLVYVYSPGRLTSQGRHLVKQGLIRRVRSSLKAVFWTCL